MKKLTQELKLLGLQPTPQQVARIKDIAIKEDRERKIAPMKNAQLYQSLVLSTSFAKALYELLYMVDEATLKFKFKKDFKNLKKLCKSVYTEFEKCNKDKTELLNAYNAYADDICEMVYSHLDRIQNR